MQILYLKFLSDYKQFKKDQIFNFSSTSEDKIDNFILNISLLVGRNGSGKTTLMSLIAQFFHHVERYNQKIQANFEICYRIGVNGRKKKVTLRHVDNLVEISVEGAFNFLPIIPKKDAQSWDRKVVDSSRQTILFDSIVGYFPKTVVTSVFSMHGEYPAARPANFEGWRLVKDRSITRIYGDNHYDLGPISMGIIRFLRLYLAKGSRIKSLLNLFDLTFEHRVLIRSVIDTSEEEWISVDRKRLDSLEASVEEDEAYLNDIEFRRGNRLICLSNMSSGEKMLLLRAISILEAIEQNSIVIIEEPELHLDPVWNRQLITLFRTLYSRFRAHILIATHDYAMINSISPNRLIFLDRGKGRLVKNTFLASYDELFLNLYGLDYKQNLIERDFLKDLDDKSLDDLKTIYNEMGNSIYKYLVYKRIQKIENNVANH